MTTILAISGSLRAASLNTALLRAAREHSPEGVEVVLYTGLADVPHYNGDLDDDHHLPAAVADLRARIGEADGLLVASPEYNHSVPGVLKNAIDWASRPKGASALQDKDIAVIGASTGNFGTARAQIALRQVFAATHSRVLLSPEVLVFTAHQRFDGAGDLHDTTTADLLRETLAALRDQIADRRAPAR
ncbi:NADPH-dependent FMN reductase [Umezawaea endophytica]|uniref:NAD(P)H-dependent oxidoreductase n=1 Tax=Umezawaea endophytica TaxID=1654476 RepID=A0A9X2VHA9_9PSEU|nr:NAD(P)H-dependent oxidoreductase [Umezawaea endophytica]MCS7476705.1 NAD(P)H-dependent oxidoreductase [Umezawaea endophytica]